MQATINSLWLRLDAASSREAQLRHRLASAELDAHRRASLSTRPPQQNAQELATTDAQEKSGPAEAPQMVALAQEAANPAADTQADVADDSKREKEGAAHPRYCTAFFHSELIWVSLLS